MLFANFKKSANYEMVLRKIPQMLLVVLCNMSDLSFMKFRAYIGEKQ